MDANVADPEAGGGKHPGLRPVLQGRGTIPPSIRVRNMRPDALDSLDPQGLPLQGGPLDNGAKYAPTGQSGLVLPAPGGGYAGGGAGDDGDLHCLLSEHNFPIYCDSSNIGAVSSSRLA